MKNYLHDGLPRKMLQSFVLELGNKYPAHLRNPQEFLAGPRKNWMGIHPSSSDFLTGSDLAYGKLNVRTRNTAICARVTGDSGQYVPVPQPAVIPSATSCLIHVPAQ